MKLWEKIRKLDPSEYLKEKYHIKGWKAEALDLVVGFLFAALLYYIILPAILGSSPPAVVVQSCSMQGSLNVGDIVVLQGVSFEQLNAPLVVLDDPVDFSIKPENASKETQQLIFPNNQTVQVKETGDTIVYTSQITGEQIVHRVIAKVKASNGNYYITKGDANKVPDAAKFECSAWSGRTCIQANPFIEDICTPEDIGWGGCIATPVPAETIAGKQLFVIPLLGHVKMLAMHIVTLGHGYPGPLSC